MKEKKKRTERIYIKVTEDEHEAIREKMYRAGVTNVSAYMRKMALEGCIIMLELEEVKEVLHLLRINTDNLNQYAEKASNTGSIYIEDIEKIKLEQKEIVEQIKKLLVRLASI